MNFLETYEIFWESNFVSIVLNKCTKVLGWSNVVCGVAGQKPPPPIYSISSYILYHVD